MFTGQINWVQIDLEDDDHDHVITAEEKFNLAMARQQRWRPLVKEQISELHHA